MGLRIVERVREEYGDDADAHMKEEMNPFTNKNKKAETSNRKPAQPSQADEIDVDADGHEETLGGGFLPTDEHEEHGDFDGTHETIHGEYEKSQGGGGFIPEEDDLNETSPPRPLKSTNPQDARFQFTNPNGVEEDDSEDDASASPVMKPKPNGRTTKTTKTSQKPPPRTSATKPKPRQLKRKPSPEDDPQSEPIPSPSEPSASPAPKPKRKAARKSETALKSHYFAQPGTDHEESDPASEETEEEVAYQPPARKGKGKVQATGDAPKAKRGRPRKTV